MNSIYVKLTGHHYEHDVYELIKSFEPEISVNFVEEESDYRCKNFIESILDKGNKKVKTIFYTSKNNFKEYVNYYDEIEGYQKISNFEYKLIKKEPLHSFIWCF